MASVAECRHLRVFGVGILGYTILGIFILARIVSVSVYKIKRYDEVQVTLGD